jgi:diguanylate cyclase (GGDEF)-like protein
VTRFSRVASAVCHVSWARINDQYGHLAGDHVLRELARLVQDRIRRDEVFARYGGEEFVIVLPETSLAGVVALAENLRTRVGSHAFSFQGEQIPVKISIGCALLQDDKAATDLIQRADEKLYQAKRGGRNRVCSWRCLPNQAPSSGRIRHFARRDSGPTALTRTLAAALRDFRLVAAGLDVVSVGVMHEGAVVVGVVVRTQPRRAVVFAACRNRCGIKGIDERAVLCPKREVHARRLRRTLVEPEIGLGRHTHAKHDGSPSELDGHLHQHLVAKRCQRCLVEPATLDGVHDVKSSVIDHASL